MNEQLLLRAVMRNLHFDEGSRHRVYKDSRGKPTVGIGHLITKKDNLKLGDRISADRLNLFFHTDVRKALAAARNSVHNFDNLPPVFQEGMVNFMFQLGDNAAKKFPKAFKLMNDGNLQAGVQELSVDNSGKKPSLWLQQTPRRARRTLAQLNTGIDSAPPLQTGDLAKQDIINFETFQNAAKAANLGKGPALQQATDDFSSLDQFTPEGQSTYQPYTQSFQRPGGFFAAESAALEGSNDRGPGVITRGARPLPQAFTRDVQAQEIEEALRGFQGDPAALEEIRYRLNTPRNQPATRTPRQFSDEFGNVLNGEEATRYYTNLRSKRGYGRIR